MEINLSILRNSERIQLSGKEFLLVENGWGTEVASKVVLNKFFYNSDGTLVEGYIAYRKDINEKQPLILWNRGGDNKSGLLDDFLAFGILGEIASWGYVVAASQYREQDEFGGNDIDDVLNLLELTRGLDFVNENSIGVEGWSRGGMMTYLLLTKTSRINCSIVIAGLADLVRNEKRKTGLSNVCKNLFGSDDEKEFLKRKKERSAVCFADKINKNTNILFIHGTADEKISYEDSVDMYNKLSRLNNGTHYELKLIENGDHYLKLARNEVSMLRKNWFERFLKFNN